MDKPLLDLYADYLISSFGPTTATGLSRLLGAGLSHDRITRFLAGEAMTSQNLWQTVKPLVRQVQTEDAVLVVDDSIVHKPYTDENDLICWHYDHATEQTVKGINCITALYCALPKAEPATEEVCVAEEVSLPVAFALVQKTETYQDKKTGKTKQARPSGAIPSARTSTTRVCSEPASTTSLSSATSSTTCGSPPRRT